MGSCFFPCATVAGDTVSGASTTNAAAIRPTEVTEERTYFHYEHEMTGEAGQK